MPEVCSNPRQPYECGWTIGYWWRWADFFSRLDVIVLGLMVVYIVVVFARVSYRCRSAQHGEPLDTDDHALQRTRRKLVADLNIWVGGIKSIAQTAPFVGLVGTCYGIMAGCFQGVGMEVHAVIAMISSNAAAALIPTAAGLLVAVPAVWSYNHLRRRIDLLEVEVPRKVFERADGHFQVAQSLPLARRFSGLPAYPLMTAPSLLLIMVYLIFPQWNISMGLPVTLAPARCPIERDVPYRIIVLHVTNAGRLFLNTEEEDWNRLAYRLSQIYSLRADKTMYLLAEDGVPFQTVANAIDIAEGTNISVCLITPIATKVAHGSAPVGAGWSKRARR
jgi:biopolymer transport protein ExbD